VGKSKVGTSTGSEGTSNGIKISYAGLIMLPENSFHVGKAFFYRIIIRGIKWKIQ